MKRLFVCIISLILILSLAACSSEKTVMFVPQTDGYMSDADAVMENTIGLSISGNGEMQSVLVSYIERYVEESGYAVETHYSSSGEEQAETMSNMLEDGVMALILMPVDVDALSDVAEEYNTAGVKIINLLDPVNARVSSLIAPDYKLIGAKGARLAKEAKKDRKLEKLNIFLLETDADSFIMQLIHDGFAEELGNDGKIIGSEHFSSGETSLEKVKEQLMKSTVVFAFNEELAVAANEINPQAAVICCGSSKDILTRVSDQSMYASIFFGIDSLAEQSVQQAVMCAKDISYEPPEYTELIIGVASESSVQDYITAAPNGFPEPK